MQTPVALMFSHDLEQASSRRGVGSALVVDTSGAQVDTLHLHLTPNAAGNRAVPPLHLDWEFGAIEGMPVPASDTALLH